MKSESEISPAHSPSLDLCQQYSAVIIMKFRTLALAAALIAPVNAQTVTNGNFTFVESHAFPSNLGAYLGGGSIIDDTLYLIVNAEESDAYMAQIPILRNGKLYDSSNLSCAHSSSLLTAIA